MTNRAGAGRFRKRANERHHSASWWANVLPALLMPFPIIVGVLVGDWLPVELAAVCALLAVVRLAYEPPFWVRRESAAPCQRTCACPICTLEGEALIEYLLNDGEDREMSLVWLSDEVRAVLLDPKLPIAPRRRLTEALRVSRPAEVKRMAASLYIGRSK